MKLLYIILVVLLLILGIAFFVKRHIIYLGIKTGTSITIHTSSFLSSGQATNECTYSIWFNINDWDDNEKILFQKLSVDGDILFSVNFGKHVNTMNVFVPGLSNGYKAGVNCKITDPVLGNSGTSVKGESGCRELCDKEPSGKCNSYSFQHSSKLTSNEKIVLYFKPIIQDNNIDLSGLTGNSAYNELMEVTANENDPGMCYLFEETPSIPNICFLGESGSTGTPYSAYDWNEFIYNANYNSGIKRPGCNIKEIPLQEWVSLVITIQGYIMEVYINGKIVKNCNLKTEINNSTDYDTTMIVTPNTGFNVSTYNFKYWNKCLTNGEINKLTKKVFS